MYSRIRGRSNGDLHVSPPGVQVLDLSLTSVVLTVHPVQDGERMRVGGLSFSPTVPTSLGGYGDKGT